MIGQAPSCCSRWSISQTSCLRVSWSGSLDCRSKQLLDLGIAVAGIIARRIAGVILVELLVGIIDATGDARDTDLVILAGEFGEPEARFDRIELAVDIDLLELVDQDHRRIAQEWYVACSDFDLETLVGPV